MYYQLSFTRVAHCSQCFVSIILYDCEAGCSSAGSFEPDCQLANYVQLIVFSFVSVLASCWSVRLAQVTIVYPKCQVTTSDKCHIRGVTFVTQSQSIRIPQISTLVQLGVFVPESHVLAKIDQFLASGREPVEVHRFILRLFFS